MLCLYLAEKGRGNFLRLTPSDQGLFSTVEESKRNNSLNPKLVNIKAGHRLRRQLNQLKNTDSINLQLIETEVVIKFFMNEKYRDTVRQVFQRSYCTLQRNASYKAQVIMKNKNSLSNHLPHDTGEKNPSDKSLIGTDQTVCISVILRKWRCCITQIHSAQRPVFTTCRTGHQALSGSHTGQLKHSKRKYTVG